MKCAGWICWWVNSFMIPFKSTADVGVIRENVDSVLWWHTWHTPPQRLNHFRYCQQFWHFMIGLNCLFVVCLLSELVCCLLTFCMAFPLSPAITTFFPLSANIVAHLAISSNYVVVIVISWNKKMYVHIVHHPCLWFRSVPSRTRLHSQANK